MADELSYDAIEVGKRYGPWEYPLAERYPRYLAAVENAQAWHNGRSPWGPPVVPPTLLGIATLSFLGELGRFPDGCVVARQNIETATALRTDRRPHVYGEFVDKYEQEGHKHAKFLARWRDETGIIVGHVTLTIAYGRGSPAAIHRANALTPLYREVTADKLATFGGGALASSMIAAEYIGELITSEFGKDWFENAGLSLELVQPVTADETLTVSGEFAERVREGAVERKVYDVWAENQAGEAVAAGQAYSLVIPGS